MSIEESAQRLAAYIRLAAIILIGGILFALMALAIANGFGGRWRIVIGG